MPVSPPDAKVTPAWAEPSQPVSPLVFGHNAVWSRAGLGLWDETTAQPSAQVFPLVRDLHPGILRFPGGTRAMRYHFDQAIGPVAGRTAQCDTFTGAIDATHYGLDEFLKVAAGAASEVTLVSPWVDGSPQEAAALIAYVNADPTSTMKIGTDANGKDWGIAGEWAARRVTNGHSAPYGVKYLEVGNEPYLGLPAGPPTSCGRPSQFRQDERWVNGKAIPTTATDYAAQVLATGMLVHAVDPAVRIGASAYSTYTASVDAAGEVAENDRAGGLAWNAALVTSASAGFDYFVLHPYDFGGTDERLLLAERLRKTVHDLRARAPAKPVAVTEFGFLVGGDTLLNALVSADMVRVAIEEKLLMVLRHILVEDNPAGLFANAAAILGPNHLKTPAYDVLQLMASTVRGASVTTASTLSGVVALAARDGGTASVVVLDLRAGASASADVEVALPPGDWACATTVLSAPALSSVAAALVRTQSHTRAAETVRVALPPHGIAVLSLTP